MHANLATECRARPHGPASGEDGFTLAELLVVVAIIGILLAIAVPSYLRYRDSANQKAASADVRAAIPDAERYAAENGTYAGMSVAALAAYDSSLAVDNVVVSGAADDTYCLDKTVNGRKSRVTRGAAALSGGKVVEGAVC